MAFDIWGPKRKPVRKKPEFTPADKKAIKSIFHNRCRICGKTEKQVGELQVAHWKASSKQGRVGVPLCPNHHRKFDKGLFTNSELEKIGMTRAQYKRHMPKNATRKKKPSLDVFGLPEPSKTLGF